MSSVSQDKIASKLAELTSIHGDLFLNPWNDGRIPKSDFANFFGRHAERQRGILSAMTAGCSYSKAYKLSSRCFDTKRWSKIPNRSASCRGLLLKAICSVRQNSEPISEEVWNESLELADAIIFAAKHQLQRLSLVPRLSEAGSFRKAKAAIQKSPSSLWGPKEILAGLRTAETKLAKNARDIPKMFGVLREQPRLRDVAATAIETAQIVFAATAVQSVFNGDAVDPDLFACIGSQYNGWFADAGVAGKTIRQIATHRSPDADALVATWMMQRFVLDGAATQVVFVPRNYVPSTNDNFDAVLDVGREHDPKKLLFDHKPPAFAHRDLHCATSLVFDHAKSIGCSVEMLRDLVDVVHDGDAATRRSKSAAYQASRTNGLHALIKAARCYAESDSMLYHGIAAFLDATYLWPSD